MEKLKHMKDCLMSCVQNQVSGNLHNVDAKELGEAIDMIKDLEEAIYYCTITKAMKEDDEEEKKIPHQQQMYNNGGSNYYTPMYNDGQTHAMNNWSNDNMRMGQHQMKDHKEGKSPIHRRMYMESKQYSDPQKQIKELEDYMHELTEDIMEMIEDSSPEEKQLLRQKITTLSTKIK